MLVHENGYRNNLKGNSEVASYCFKFPHVSHKPLGAQTK
jgi:hypothetical protein